MMQECLQGVSYPFNNNASLELGVQNLGYWVNEVEASDDIFIVETEKKPPWLRSRVCIILILSTKNFNFSRTRRRTVFLLPRFLNNDYQA